MKLPFKKGESAPMLSITVSFSSDNNGNGEISIESEGNGAYVKLATDGPIFLNPDELSDLANWCVETCDELDLYHGELQSDEEQEPLKNEGPADDQ